MARRTNTRRGAAVVMDLQTAGFDEFRQLLAAMPRQMRTVILQPLVQRLSQAGANIAKANVRRMLPKRPVEQRRWDRPTGALHDSLGARVIPASRMRNPELVYGVFGARSQFRTTAPTRRKIARIRRPRFRGTQMAGPIPVGKILTSNKRSVTGGWIIKPSKYLHLVERGHRGAPGHRIPPARPYPVIAETRLALRAIMPTLIRQQWNVLYPRAINGLKARYLRRIRTLGSKS